MEIAVENLSQKARAGNRTADLKSVALPSVPAHPELAYYSVQQKANFKASLKAGVTPPIAIDTHLTPLGGCQVNGIATTRNKMGYVVQMPADTLTPRFSSFGNTLFRNKLFPQTRAFFKRELKLTQVSAPKALK